METASWHVWVEIKRRGSLADVLMRGNTQQFRLCGTLRVRATRVYTHARWGERANAHKRFEVCRATSRKRSDHEDFTDFTVNALK